METEIDQCDQITHFPQSNKKDPSIRIGREDSALKDALQYLVELAMNSTKSSVVAATLSSVEPCILELLELKQSCTYPLSEEIVRCIRAIREKCQHSERQELTDGGGGGQFTWRRGESGNVRSGYNTVSSNVLVSTNHGTNVQTNSSKNKGSSSIPNQWRGQSGNSARPSVRQQASSERPAGRYVSKFTNVTSPVEDKILNQVILNKLNKFSQANYEEVKEFLQQILDSNESDFLRDFMLLVFKKAASEPTFCPLYARIISELSVKYTSLLVQLEKLYDEYLTIFEEVSEDQCTSYEHFVQRNREKIHRQGYSQFLGELTSIGVLNQIQVLKLYKTVFHHIKLQGVHGEGKQQLLEEYVDCLLRMSRAIQKGKSSNLLELRKCLLKECEPVMEDLLAKRASIYPGLSKKASFGIMDCLDIFRGN